MEQTRYECVIKSEFIKAKCVKCKYYDYFTEHTNTTTESECLFALIVYTLKLIKHVCVCVCVKYF